jgi:hypothetical protein
MNHQKRVNQFFEKILSEGKLKRTNIVDEWLWSHGYQTPPSVAWPLWAIILEITMFWLILRPFLLVPFIFFFPLCPQAGFLTEYWNALAIDSDEIVLGAVIIGTATWTRTYFMPWKRWRQVWKEIDDNDTTWKPSDQNR